MQNYSCTNMNKFAVHFYLTNNSINSCDILRPLKVFCFAKNPRSVEDDILTKNDVSFDFSHTLKLFQNHCRILHKNIPRSKNALLDISFSNLDKFETKDMMTIL